MEELQRQVEQLLQENKDLRERLVAAEAMIKKLTELLGQNSRNSNWPSSRDKTRSPKPKSQRKASNRSPGGQKGHKGHTLAPSAKPDEIVVHQPDSCQHCQKAFSANADITEVTKRQVLDLPPLRYVTIEHQRQTIMCQGCGKKTCGSFPAGVTQPVQYGSGVKQLSVYLRTEQFVPYGRSQQLLQDLFKLPVSVGSLQNFIMRAADKVTEAVDSIKEAVVVADVVHADETGFYIGGQRHWLHTASTPQLSHFFPHRHRGRKAVDAGGIIARVKGTLVHDAWPTYFMYDTAHALCNVHHLRDLTAIIENDQHLWARQMQACLLASKALVDEAHLLGEKGLSAATLTRIELLYDAIVLNGLCETPPPERTSPGKQGRWKRTKARNLVERFDRRKEAVLRYTHDFKVPFDNNLAERDIRMMKVQQKVSGCFRSTTGAEQFCKLRSYTATIRKQGTSVWPAIGSLFGSNILMPQLTPV